MWLWCAAAPCRCHTSLLIDWWWVLCEDSFVKAESDVCCTMPNSSPCLVWDFFGLFSGSGRYNGHIMPLRMGQNICQEWSRLIAGPVTVGGPLVTQCSAEILKRKFLKEHLRIYLFVLLLSLPCVLFGVILIWAYLCVRVCVFVREWLCITTMSLWDEMGALSSVCGFLCVWEGRNADFISSQIMRLRTWHLKEEFQWSFVQPKTFDELVQERSKFFYSLTFYLPT